MKVHVFTYAPQDGSAEDIDVIAFCSEKKEAQRVAQKLIETKGINREWINEIEIFTNPGLRFDEEALLLVSNTYGEGFGPWEPGQAQIYGCYTNKKELEKDLKRSYLNEGYQREDFVVRTINLDSALMTYLNQ